jgi:uncharacterized protein involved in exopolysaccharide biosynthesis
VARRPFLALLPVLIVLMTALAFGLTRTPVYTASAQILVGRIDVEASAVPGFVEANQRLAATYARLVGTSVIAERVSGAVGLPPKDVRGRLSGSPIPESSIIQVEATGSSSADAVELASAAAEQLISYVVQSNENPARQQQLLDAYGAAAVEQRAAESARDAAQGALASAQGAEASPTVVADRRTALNNAQAALDEANLRATTAESAYRDSQRGAVDRGALQIITRAESAGNDRRSRLQLAVVGSLLLGGTIGVALASLRENRKAAQGSRFGRREAGGRPS